MSKITSEKELGAFFQLTPDLVCIAGKDAYLKKVNPVFISKFGYTEEELYAHPFLHFVHPDDHAATISQTQKLLAGHPVYDFRNRYITKQGEIVWLEWTCVFLPETNNILAIARDVTDKVESEKELEGKYRKFKRLATHFKGEMEKDRKLFAYEMHEELAQLSAALKMDIDWLGNSIANLSSEEKGRFKNASRVSALLIKTLQRIAFMASPNMLDDFGLATTLEFFCQEFSRIYRIPCQFSGGCNEKLIEPALKIDFFRICQEILIGMADPQKSIRLSVLLEEEQGVVHLIISDEGDGLTVITSGQQMAWESVRRRVESISGSVSINSREGSEVAISVACKNIPGRAAEPC